MSDADTSPRARILRATSELLATGGRAAVSTRAVSAAADVQPQTIYRQFGDMSGLLAEAAREGFRRYLASKSSRVRRPDPVDDLRDGWDLHIEFGLRNPALYLLMYGEPDADQQIAEVGEAAAILHGLVEAVARAGRLRIDVETAAAMIHSAGVGVVITLLSAKADRPSGLSERVREAVLRAITVEEATGPDASSTPAEAAAVHAAALRALVGAATDLTPGETLILTELLTRISAGDESPSGVRKPR
ncbi:AcrR family transcriptional regulator [Crossiella equi]|uniref:AcrR family transcriptional regulator n=1 Tax=Crossiella equi TaxID=130796 RepID=A0ABS5A6Q8_9PSEU|nr:TetR/AcrR family transcriptional regulator [Crossiella equi]MBP2472282.1 AcrR family transcriptional regulator [Crossiella equi]